MRRIAVIVAIFALVFAAAGLCLYFFERPTHLRVAVTREGDDRDILAAAAHNFSQGELGVRLKLVPADTLAQSAALFEEGKVDLAVVRADVAAPAEGQTVLILRRNAAVLAAPAGSPLKEVRDLAGKRVAVVETAHAGRGSGALLDAALEQADVKPSAVRRVEIAPRDLAAALSGGVADAALIVDTPGSDTMDAAVGAVTRAGEGPPAFIPIEDAAAIAQRRPDFEEVEVLRGAFGGAPPKPASNFDTLGVATRLVARRSLSDDVVAALTEQFLSARPALALREPLAARIEPPSTDRGATPPAHPGALAYLDDDEQTFFDKYSDFIYIGAMLASFLGTAAATLAARLGARRDAGLDGVLLRLTEVMRAARAAETLPALAMLEQEADGALAQALAHDWAHAAAPGRAAATGLALAEARQAIADRRRALAGIAK
ncbi:ABC transporter substrate-binding protein [Methylocella sp.]|uniref:ABC transporter substrate-binding protein n=1 Tax=Methylocella sp. TaxID=1978226 RepID=UPI00378346CB